MENDNYIFVIGKNDLNTISTGLTISDVFDVRDRSKKRLILSKLSFESNYKFFIESNFLKVLNVDLGKNKIILELDEISNKIFRSVDNKAIELLGDLLENNVKLENIDIDLEGDLTYIPMVSDNKNNADTLRLCLDTKTTLMYNKNIIDLNQIKVGDMFRFLVGLESINLYSSESICFIRTYCHTGEIYRTNIDKLTKRTPMNNYIFSTDVENVFQKVILDDQDISLIKTEVENNFSDKEIIKEISINNDSNMLNAISETEEQISNSSTSSNSNFSNDRHKNIFSKQHTVNNNNSNDESSKNSHQEREEQEEQEEQEQLNLAVNINNKPKRTYTRKNQTNKKTLENNTKKTINTSTISKRGRKKNL